VIEQKSPAKRTRRGNQQDEHFFTHSHSLSLLSSLHSLLSYLELAKEKKSESQWELEKAMQRGLSGGAFVGVSEGA